MSVQNKNLSQSLSQDGYAVAKSVLASDLLDTLRQQRDYVPGGLSQAHREAYQPQGSLVNLGDYPEFSHLIGSAVLQKLIQGLGPASCCWLAGYLISKSPRSPALFWHQDWWGWDHPLSYTSRLLSLGVMIYLSDTRRENGCLRVIPGSHRCQHRLHALPVAHEESLSHIEDPDNIAYQSDESEVAVEETAGDVVLLDPRLLHSAYPNETDEERSLITLWYLPEFNELPPTIRARYMNIFNRRNLDTGDSDTGDLLDAWTEHHRRAIADLVPIFQDDDEPYPFNRAPQQHRMLSSIQQFANEPEALCD